MWEKIIDDISPKTSQFKILVYLSFKGPSYPSDISKETTLSPGTVRPSLRTLFKKGYIVQLDDGSYQSLIPFTEIVSHLYSKKK
jgi:DNA-binding MarR family transcriptional regulator